MTVSYGGFPLSDQRVWCQSSAREQMEAQQRELYRQAVKAANSSPNASSSFGAGADQDAAIVKAQLFAIPQAYQQSLAEHSRPGAEPLKRTGLEVGEITAWRAWHVDDGFLKSTGVDYPWLPDDVIEGTPGDHDEVGVYAYKNKADAFRHSQRGVLMIVGSVFLWGEVVEHEIGYRAQFGKICSLDFVRPNTAKNRVILAEIRNEYRLTPHPDALGG